MESKSPLKSKSYAIEVDTDHLVQLVENLRAEVDAHISNQNKPAHWAESLANRIDRMEQMMTGDIAVGKYSSTGGSSIAVPKFDSDGNKLTLEQIRAIEAEIRIVKLAASTVMIDVLAIRDANNTRLNSYEKEIVRTDRLINQLPTAELMESVIGAVSTVEYRIVEAYEGIEQTISQLTHRKVTKEVDVLADMIFRAKVKADAEVEQILKRGQWFQQDLYDLISGNNHFTSGCSRLTKEAEEVVEMANNERVKLSDELERKSERIRSEIDEIKAQGNIELDKFNQSKVESKLRTVDIDEDLSKFGNLLQKTDNAANNLSTEFQMLMDDVLLDMKDFNKMVADKKTFLNLKFPSIEASIEDMQEVMGKNEEFAESIKELNLIEFLSTSTETMKETVEKDRGIRETMSEYSTDNVRILKSFEDVREGVDSLVKQSKMQEADLKVHDAKEKVQNNIISSYESKVIKLEEEKKKYMPLLGDVTNLREILARTDLQLKVNDNAMLKLLGRFSEKESKFESIIEKMEMNSSSLVQKGEANKERILEILESQFEQNNEALEHLKEAIELHQQMVESQRTGIPMKSPNKGPKKPGNEEDFRDDSTQGDAAADINVPINVGLDDEEMETIYQIANVLADFEDNSVGKQYVNDIPGWGRELIASACQQLTKSLAEITDSEIIKKTLGDGEMVVNEDGTSDTYNKSILELRVKKLDLLVAEIKRIAQKRNPQGGKIRMEARSKFLRLLRKALDLSMSKHNQIITVGNSRFGRVKCDSLVRAPQDLQFGNSSRHLFAISDGETDDEEGGARGEICDSGDANNTNSFSISIDMGVGAGTGSGFVNEESKCSPRTPRGSRVVLPPITPSDLHLSMNSSFDHSIGPNNDSFLGSPKMNVLFEE